MGRRTPATQAHAPDEREGLGAFLVENKPDDEEGKGCVEVVHTGEGGAAGPVSM